MKKVFLISGALFAFVLSGCASQATLTYKSEPSYAYLFCNGKNMGPTPRTLYYKIGDKEKAQGFMKTQVCYAQWLDGKSKTYEDEFPINPKEASFSKNLMVRHDQDETLPEAVIAAHHQEMYQFASELKDRHSSNQWISALGTVLVAVAGAVAVAAGTSTSGGGVQIPQIPVLAVSPMEMPNIPSVPTTFPTMGTPKQNMHTVQRINGNMYSVDGEIQLPSVPNGNVVRVNDNMYSVIGGGTYSINRINDNMYSVHQVIE